MLLAGRVVTGVAVTALVLACCGETNHAEPLPGIDFEKSVSGEGRVVLYVTWDDDSVGVRHYPCEGELAFSHGTLSATEAVTLRDLFAEERWPLYEDDSDLDISDVGCVPGSAGIEDVRYSIEAFAPDSYTLSILLVLDSENGPETTQMLEELEAVVLRHGPDSVQP